jgi:Zn-dependent protease/CBS domain-containing protein
LSFQIAKVKGIPVRLHFTLIIVFLLITWTLASSFMPQYFPDLAPIQYWIMGIAGAIVLFASVFLHELMHSIVALRYGVKVRQIILFIFGGVSDIQEETKDFRKEFRIAAAGPVASFVIAGIFAAIWWPISQITTTTTTTTTTNANLLVIEGVLLYGAIVNVLLGAFNLIPAFPLDGGRILRAGLIRWKKSYNEATRIAARIGIGVSYGFMGIGFFAMLFGSFVSGIWILLIGWFLNSGAQSYLAQHQLTSVLANVRLQDMMNTRVIAVGKDMSISELLGQYFGRYMKSSFPVVDESGRLLGMVNVQKALDVPEYSRQSVRVAEIMIPVSQLAVMLPETRADQGLEEMMRTGTGKIFVCDAQGIMLGLVSKTDIMDVAKERQELQEKLGSISKSSADRRQQQSGTSDAAA